MKISKAYDVVVIGSGGAGLRAAVGAAGSGAKTLILTRGKVNRSGATLLAGANISADLSCDGATLARLGIIETSTDTPEAWMQDILHEGFHLNNQSLVLRYVNSAGERLTELLDMGVKLLGMEGEREVTLFGSDILDKLHKKAVSLGADVLEDMVFTDLVTRDGGVCGAVCLDIMEGEPVFFPAKAVVIATGGCHGMFSFSSGSTDLCGEGQSAALRAGAELVDMEIISFCPTVITHPEIYRGNILPYIFCSVGFGEIKNKFGKGFISRYLSPKAERLATDTEWNKMLLSHAMQREIDCSRANMNGGLYFSIDCSKEIMDEMYADLPPLRTGIYADIMKLFERGRSVTVRPSAHYFEGGILVDSDMAAGLHGLFSAGECAGGMFGANRVCAATTEMLVEGAIAGESAGRYCEGTKLLPPEDGALSYIEEAVLAPFRTHGGDSAVRVTEAIAALRHEVETGLAVIRNEITLSRALEYIRQASRTLSDVVLSSAERRYNLEWIEYLQYRNMLLSAGASVASALIRRESRGVHYRSDCPYTDNDAFLKNIIVTNTSFDTREREVDCPFGRPEDGVRDYMSYLESTVERLEENEG